MVSLGFLSIIICVFFGDFGSCFWDKFQWGFFFFFLFLNSLHIFVVRKLSRNLVMWVSGSILFLGIGFFFWYIVYVRLNMFSLLCMRLCLGCGKLDTALIVAYGVSCTQVGVF